MVLGIWGEKPVEQGFGEKFSVTEPVLAKGREWSNGNGVQQVGAHLLVPITVAAATAIDALAHALLTATKLVGCAANTVVWAVSGGHVGFSVSLTPSQMVTHAWKTAASVGFFAVGTAISIVSSGTATSLASLLGLAEGEKKPGYFKQLWDNSPAGGWETTKHIAKALATDSVESGKSAAKSAATNAKYYAWDYFANHRVAQIATLGAIGLAYAGRAYQTGSFTQPASDVYAGVTYPVRFTWHVGESILGWVKGVFVSEADTKDAELWTQKMAALAPNLTPEQRTTKLAELVASMTAEERTKLTDHWKRYDQCRVFCSQPELPRPVVA